jgi:hypothetical protein
MRTTTIRCTIPAVATLAGLVSGLLAACGNPGDMGRAVARSRQKQANLAACTQGRLDDLIPLAVTAYVKAATPKPQRFLVATGTDSSVGDAGMRSLQDKGPTYLFPGDPAMQANVRAQLHEKGDYTTLLVVRRGGAVHGSRASVDLAGHYIGGEEEGTHAGPRTFTFSCDSSGWRLASPGGVSST